MTKLLYHEKPYEKEFDATVIDVMGGNIVILDRTLFYPQGGGQPTDTGFLINSLNGRRNEVLAVRKNDGRIEHRVHLPGLQKGDPVKGEIDWNRRYRHMRMHTAQHLLSAIVLDDYNAATAGNQISWPTTRIDFEYKFTKDDLDRLEKRFNEIVDRCVEVKSYFVHRNEIGDQNIDPKRLRLFEKIPETVHEIRIVEIVGIDKNPCGGIQVLNTKEIGRIKIEKTENVGAGKTRIIYSLSDH